MKKWSIVTDSSCDFVLPEKADSSICFAKVPFVISVGQHDFVDTKSLDIENLLTHMETCPTASHTSCPSPGNWIERFEQAQQIIAITISAKLSGSYNSAMTAREMILEQTPEKKIYVLDSRSAGSALTMYAEKAAELIEGGSDFHTVVSGLEEYRKHRHTIFALSSFNNLVKNGRISKAVGFIAGKLGIWGIGIGSKEGEIIVKNKTRGVQKVIGSFLADMKEHAFAGGYVVISHCQNLELAAKLRDKIQETWHSAKVKILETGGLCSYYAERNGLIVAY